MQYNLFPGMFKVSCCKYNIFSSMSVLYSGKTFPHKLLNQFYQHLKYSYHPYPCLQDISD